MTTDQAPPTTISLTVGTAGHIDHGKTQAVKFLTGCDTDRLPEEKARGLTIDLGFATCELPNHRRVGIVDVPGHERFVHNMVAGATGIDAVMLIVAADDGVMPQTIEHFHIVRLLGIRSGLVVVTKTDLVSGERLEEVIDEVRILVDGSFLENAPIVPFSSKTGEGFDGFYDAFAATVDKTAERDANGPFRMHIERSFVIKGRGVIVSGIPRSGTVKTGDTLELLPGKQRKRVRGLQVYGKDDTRGVAGECVALDLNDLSREEAQRGVVLASPDYFEPTRFVNARFQLLPEYTKALKPRTAIRFHVGTADAPGHLVLPELKPLAPGQESYVQIQLKRPVVAAPGDFFVVRLLSPTRTIGGGYVLASERKRMRRTKGTWMKEVEEQEAAFHSPATAVRLALEHADQTPLSLDELARQTMLDPNATRDTVEALVGEGAVARLSSDRYVSAEAFTSAKEEILSVLDALHKASPLSLGFAKKEIVPKLASQRVVCDAAWETLLADETLLETDAGYRLPDRGPRLSEKQTALAQKIASAFLEAEFVTPRFDELPEQIGVPAPLLKPILDYLLQSGTLVRGDDRVAFHRDLIEESRHRLTDWLTENGQIEAAQTKTLLNTTRKYAIPILEYWDRQGLTKRVGNARVLRQQPKGTAS